MCASEAIDACSGNGAPIVVATGASIPLLHQGPLPSGLSPSAPESHRIGRTVTFARHRLLRGLASIAAVSPPVGTYTQAVALYPEGLNCDCDGITAPGKNATCFIFAPLPWLVRSTTLQEVERVGHHRLDRAKRLDGSPTASWRIHDQRAPACACHRARKQTKVPTVRI